MKTIGEPSARSPCEQRKWRRRLSESIWISMYRPLNSARPPIDAGRSRSGADLHWMGDLRENRSSVANVTSVTARSSRFLDYAMWA